MEHNDGKFDRDGQRIENPIPGMPIPGAPNEHEVIEQQRAAHAAWAAACGDWSGYFHEWAPENMGRERTRD